MAMKPTRMVRRRREVQAYYGSAQSDRSRLPFLLEPPAPANAFASMVSSRNTVAALRKTVGGNWMRLRLDSPHNGNKIWFYIADLWQFSCVLFSRNGFDSPPNGFVL
jgi:hypothetical protein